MAKIARLNSATGKLDAYPTRHIITRNMKLEGQNKPGTNVKYIRSSFILDGAIVEGVFPAFDSIFTVMLPDYLRCASDSKQFRFCTRQLSQAIQNDPRLANMFSSCQHEQIIKCNPHIPGLTWHHNHIPGKMELVDANVHRRCGHTGGRCIWGGGKR